MYHTDVQKELIHILKLASSLAMGPRMINGANYQKYVTNFKSFAHYIHTDVMGKKQDIYPSSDYSIYYLKLNHCEFDIKQLSLFQNDNGKINNTYHGNYPISIILFNLNQNLHDIISLIKEE